LTIPRACVGNHDWAIVALAPISLEGSMSLISGHTLEQIQPRSHNLLGRMLLRLTVLWRHMREWRKLSHMEESQLRELLHVAKRQGKTL
jgi:hypothetical protein